MRMTRSDGETMKEFYERLAAKLDIVRSVMGRPLTLTDKILYTHLWDPCTRALTRGAASAIIAE